MNHETGRPSWFEKKQTSFDLYNLAVCCRNFNDDTSKEVTVNEKYLCMSDRVSRVMVLIPLNKREEKL